MNETEKARKEGYVWEKSLYSLSFEIWRLELKPDRILSVSYEENVWVRKKKMMGG